MSVTRESAVLRVIRALKSETKAAQAVSTSVVQRRPRITLGIAMPKGSRGDWLVEKATELGVTAIAPLAAERSILKVEEGFVFVVTTII
jgi:16S rRNA (uracil1498-N3)-methyltransferase